MSQWWTYRPEDFLLFSERVYWRLFELHNAALWPGQIAALALGAAILFLLVRPRPGAGRFIAPVLAAAWAVTAWTFLWQRYAPVNWAAGYAAWLFMAQALLLLWRGTARGGFAIAARGHVGRGVAAALFAYALFLHPLIAVVAGRPLGGAEVFALAPDPTAMATLGVLALGAGGWRDRLLLPIPLLWCAASTATLWTLGTWQAVIPAAAAPLALLARQAARPPAT